MNTTITSTQPADTKNTNTTPFVTQEKGIGSSANDLYNLLYVNGENRVDMALSRMLEGARKEVGYGSVDLRSPFKTAFLD